MSVSLISSFQLFCTLFFIPLVEEVAVCTHRRTVQEEHKILPFYRCTNKAPVCARNKPSFIWHPASCTHFNLCYFPKCIQIFMSLFLPLPFTLLVFFTKLMLQEALWPVLRNALKKLHLLLWYCCPTHLQCWSQALTLLIGLSVGNKKQIILSLLITLDCSLIGPFARPNTVKVLTLGKMP